MFKLWIKILVVLLLVVMGVATPADARVFRSWGGARQGFLKGVLTDPKQPRAVRGYLQNQMNRWRRAGKTGLPRFKNPKGYDIGHHPMKRGSFDPKDLRLETSHDNRSRPQRSKAAGRKKGIIRQYF